MVRFRDIVHVDVDAFFASVEQVLDPRLRGKPVLVGGPFGLAQGRPEDARMGGNPEDRSVVASASYEARAYGIRSAMPLAQARRLCPDAICLPGNFEAYGDFSGRVRTVLLRFTPLVETASLDDFYLDLTGCRPLHGPPLQAAERMKAAVRSETGLSVTLVIAANKLVAKVASDLAKPDGILEVWRGCEAAFLRALPVGRLPGIGPSTEEILSRFNLVTIGDLARIPPADLERMFGAWGLALGERAHGRDDSPVVVEASPPKTIGRESTFAQDTTDRGEVRALLYSLTERAARQLRGAGLLARRVTVKVRYADFQTVTAARTLPAFTDQDKALYEAALERLDRLLERRMRVRLVGVTLSALLPAEDHQSDLFAEGEFQRRKRFYRGLDRVREKFGFEIAHVGPLLRVAEEGRMD